MHHNCCMVAASRLPCSVICKLPSVTSLAGHDGISNLAAVLLCRVNGLTHINLTKLDVLSQLDTIKLGVRYTLNGQPITSVPAQLEQLEQVQVEYEELPGWQSDISKVDQCN